MHDQTFTALPRRDTGAAVMAPGRLTIDLGALAQNYRLLADKLDARTAIAGVVKANAYGLGMDRVVPILEYAGCPLYFVATPQEAIALRALTEKPIAVLGGLMGPAEEYLKHKIRPVLNSLRDIEIWSAATAKFGRLGAILHFDTGMNRLGLAPDEWEILRREPQRLNNLDVEIIMTHMACADERHNKMTAAQYESFAAIAAYFPDARKSVANSSAIFRSNKYHLDIARPGMALYGLNPTPEQPNPMKPVVGLDVRVLQVRKVRNGESVGYGGATIMTYDGVLATVALGYADGLPRSATNNISLYWQGEECPIRGRVSMDTVIVDITGLKPPPMAGDYLEVIGPHQSADDLATACGTIGYEILTGLGARYQRIYKGL